MAGISIRITRYVTNAFMLKVVYEFCLTQSRLWEKILLSKYKYGDHPIPKKLKAENVSNVWRQLLLFGIICESILWRLGIGSIIYF